MTVYLFNAVKVNGEIKLGVVSITVDVVSVNVRTFNGNITSTIFSNNGKQKNIYSLFYTTGLV